MKQSLSKNEGKFCYTLTPHLLDLTYHFLENNLIRINQVPFSLPGGSMSPGYTLQLLK
jgi:hypothetical protein